MSSTATSPDRIEKTVVLRAPRARVWRALTNHEEFGQWFGVIMDKPFTPGAAINGKILDPKYAHMPFTMTIDRVEPERLFSIRWHPYARRSCRRLLCRADHADRVHARRGPRGHAAHGRRVGLRSHSDRTPRPGLPDERRGLGGSDAEHQETCRTDGLMPASRPRNSKSPRRSSRRSATKRACGSWPACARAGRNPSRA